MNYQEIEKQIDSITRTIDKMQKNPRIPDHFHNGFDTSRIKWTDIYQRKVYVHHTLYGATAATAANYGTFYIVPTACVLTKFQEVHQVAGSDAGAVSVTLEKLTSTTAPDSGSVMLASVLSLKATANTVQTGTITATLANRTLAAGNRLCLKDAGTLTDVSNVTVVVELKII